MVTLTVEPPAGPTVVVVLVAAESASVESVVVATNTVTSVDVRPTVPPSQRTSCRVYSPSCGPLIGSSTVSGAVFFVVFNLQSFVKMKTMLTTVLLLKKHYPFSTRCCSLVVMAIINKKENTIMMLMLMVRVTVVVDVFGAFEATSRCLL